ncbi:MAG: bifunctional phosphoribosyl-AMP cyclohydrolase/phosphoribosyl-ATP diphosphatase HisIE [Bacteroidota bacterium]|nr:bifunctional phosphoribosyl-AMP cyclohydrolase/phosphoribosyl-ATP diphosphatase HisIE [Bacteroidota bacterium]
MKKDYSELVKRIDFSKSSSQTVPAIIQDSSTNVVLMLGYMNRDALLDTIDSGLVTFFSRSKNRLWVKGETSKHYLHVVDIKSDCDSDTLLITAKPDGNVCHTGAETCFNEENTSEDFLRALEKIIEGRKKRPVSGSYTSTLFKSGINKMAQKVGEEAVELVIEAKDNNQKLFINEAADLLFHYLILLQAKNKTLDDVIEVLEKRHKGKE